MELHQRVKCAKTGKNHVGELAGLLDADVYLRGADPARFTEWNNVFGDSWVNNPIGYVRLDEPQPYCTFEQFMIGSPHLKDVPEEKCRKIYSELVYHVTMVACPIDGIEVLDG